MLARSHSLVDLYTPSILLGSNPEQTIYAHFHTFHTIHTIRH